MKKMLSKPMRTIKYRWISVIIATVCLVPSVFPADRDTVVVARPLDISASNFIETKDGKDAQVFSCIQQGLMIMDGKTGEWRTNMAKSAEIIDGKDVRVELRKGLRFHSGDPVTAHDVAFTIEQIQDPFYASLGGFLMDEIEEVEVIDDYTLVFRFYEPMAIWKGLISYGVLSRKYFEKAGREIFRQHPVGWGPFRFVEWKRREHILLEAAETFEDYQVNFKKLKIVIVEDPSTRMAMMLAGQADFIYQILPHQMKRLKGQKNIRVKINSLVPNIRLLALNPINDPILRDPKLIAAMKHAINREEIVEKVFLGQAEPLYGGFSRSEIGFDPDRYYEYNPQKARDLLRQTDYLSGKVLKLVYTQDTAFTSLIAQIIQKYLKAVGISVEINQMEAGAYSTYYIEKKYGNLGHLGFTGWGGYDPYLKLMLVNHSKGPLYLDIGPPKYGGEPNHERIDELITQQAHIIDVEKRLRILHRIQQELENSPSVPLYTLYGIYAMNERIEYTMPLKQQQPTHLWTIRMVE